MSHTHNRSSGCSDDSWESQRVSLYLHGSWRTVPNSRASNRDSPLDRLPVPPTPKTGDK